MNTYKEREEEAYRIMLNELGVEILCLGEQSILSTSARTDEEQQDLVISILVLQAKLFELALRIDTSINNDKNTHLMRSKKVYAEAVRFLDISFYHHAESLVDNKFTIQKVNMEKSS